MAAREGDLEPAATRPIFTKVRWITTNPSLNPLDSLVLEVRRGVAVVQRELFERLARCDRLQVVQAQAVLLREGQAPYRAQLGQPPGVRHRL